jgi:uncharacterized repeat protein (TIGR03803 family)
MKAAFSSATFLVVLVACSHPTTMLPTGAADTTAIRSRTSSVASTVYEFTGNSSGVSPAGPLLSIGGIFYGTTQQGGAGRDCPLGNYQGCGAVYSYNPASGYETILHSFRGGKDGVLSDDLFTSQPSLLTIDGQLYGTTTWGGGSGCRTDQDGAVGCGTIFQVDPATGFERVVHRFQARVDGMHPTGIIAIGSMIYGTTSAGGGSSCGCGTVYSFDTSTNVERVLYRFAGVPDGKSPNGPVALNGKLFGTTQGGGSPHCGGGCGTIFSVDMRSGEEVVLYQFKGENDGYEPRSPLVTSDGFLYGTAAFGGTAGGTVFVFNPVTRRERTIYGFKTGSDGEIPEGALLDEAGKLYGITALGGDTNCGGSAIGCGTVFMVDPRTDREQIVHAFEGGTDGIYPAAGLSEMNGKLYGTTGFGGDPWSRGTIFAVSL